jgi:hypothetical protein
VKHSPPRGPFDTTVKRMKGDAPPQRRSMRRDDGPSLVAIVRPRRPPRLEWTPVRGARYNNLQLWRNGRKILSTWPAQARYSRRDAGNSAARAGDSSQAGTAGLSGPASVHAPSETTGGESAQGTFRVVRSRSR